jgi:tetratricopeptide (TPR) repeat protein
MRNWRNCSGVYSGMVRVPLLLLYCLTALAQPGARQDPLDAATEAVWRARSMGRFSEAAAGLEQARAELQRTPAGSARFAGWARQVAQLYQSSGWNARARAVLQEALDRTGALGDSHPTRTGLLTALGDLWQQDGNLLKAVDYLEQAATAQASAPTEAAPQFAERTGRIAVMGTFAVRTTSGSSIYAYTRLADLYQRLGRPDAVAAVAVKIRALASNDPAALARFYEQFGRFEEAAAIYKKMTEQPADAQAVGNAWQSLANLYAGQEHYTDAVAAMKQAIAAVEASDKAGMRGQTVWMRQNLASLLRRADLTDQADQVYQQILQETRGGPQENQALGAYAQHLAETQRAAQGESLLKEYLAETNLETPAKMNILFQLSNVARMSGDSKRADEYQAAGMALQEQPSISIEGQVRIAGDVQKAESALSQQRLDEAYGLALRAIDHAAHAVDGQQVDWLVPQVATRLAAAHEPAKAEQLFRRLFALEEGRQVETVQPLIAVTQMYARFLMEQPERADEAAGAIESYRRVLTDANGAESGSMAEPLHLRMEMERGHGQWEKAEASGRELLELQERLSGNTSEAYLGELQNLARLYEAAGETARAVLLLRKAVGIADLNTTPNNAWLRSATRMEAAMALARLGQFDEAEALGMEGVALEGKARVPKAEPAQELEQIREMRGAAEAAKLRR